MKRIVLDETSLIGNDIVINSKEIYHYLIGVRRFKVSDELEVLIKGKETRLCKIKQIDSSCIHLSTLSTSSLDLNNSVEISLFISTLKGKKLDLLMRQVTEIGISSVNILQSEHSVSVLDNNISSKSARFLKIIDEALKQSGNKVVPKLSFFKDFYSVPYDNEILYFVAHQDGDSNNKYDLRNANKIAILIGPEGGFSKAEVNFFKEKNFNFVKFNTPVLRAETAVLYSLIYLKTLIEVNNG